MKKIFLASVAAALLSGVSVSAQQVGGDFETWENCYPFVGKSKVTTAVGTQPKGWCGSNVYGMSGTGSNGDLVTKTTGRDGSGSAAKLSNTKVGAMGITEWTPAYLTLGTTWNTAKVSILGKKSNQDGGTFGGLSFTNKPDAVRFYYKRQKDTDGKASFIGYIWSGHDAQASVPTEVKIGTPTTTTMTDRDRNILGKTTSQGGTVTKGSTLIASFEEYVEDAAADWTEKVIPFKYEDNVEAEPQMLNLIFSSNDYFSTSVAAAANTLIVDDVTLIYYKHLSALTIDGTTPSGFSADDESGTTVSIDASQTEYTDGIVSCTAAGRGATVEQYYDPATAVLTITVEGNDYDESTNADAKKVYNIQFKKVYDVASYNSSILVYFNEYGTPSDYDIKILTRQGSSVAGFLLNDFSFSGMDMGSIYVKSLDITKNPDGSTSYTNTTPEQVYVEGLETEVPVGVKAGVDAKGNLTGTMTINLGELGEVTVTVGKLLTIAADKSIAVTALGTTNVAMTRTFAKGWNTLCLPFDFTTAQIAADAVAQEFTSADGGALNFTKVADGALKAGKPYLVWVGSETAVGTADAPLYLGTTVDSGEPAPVTFSGYTFVGNYEAKKDMNGLYGVADQGEVQKILRGATGSTIGATSAYFKTGNAGANGLAIRFDGNTTGITTANGDILTDDAPVYTIGGVRVAKKASELPAGIYVSKGRKFIVK